MPNDLLRRMYKNTPQDMPAKVDMPALWEAVENVHYWRKDGSGAVRTRLAQVIHLLYDRDGSASGLSLQDVGEIVGVTRNRIAQNRDTAFRVLKHPDRRKLYEVKT